MTVMKDKSTLGMRVRLPYEIFLILGYRISRLLVFSNINCKIFRSVKRSAIKDSVLFRNIFYAYHLSLHSTKQSRIPLFVPMYA
jgi:hypothetical protein